MRYYTSRFLVLALITFCFVYVAYAADFAAPGVGTGEAFSPNLPYKWTNKNTFPGTVSIAHSTLTDGASISIDLSRGLSFINVETGDSHTYLNPTCPISCVPYLYNTYTIDRYSNSSTETNGPSFGLAYFWQGGTTPPVCSVSVTTNCFSVAPNLHDKLVCQVLAVNGTSVTEFDCNIAGNSFASVLSTYDPVRTPSNIRLSNSNLTALSISGSDTIVPTTLFHSSGKWNLQFTVTSQTGGGSTAVGLASSTETTGQYLGKTTQSVGVYDNGSVFIGNSAIGGGTGISMSNGDVINIVVDLTNKTIQEAKNGGSLSSTISIATLATFTLSAAVSLHANPDQITWTPVPTNAYSGASGWN